MSEAIQPESFDLIVLGTGLQESLVAAAASSAGQSVLQLDPDAEYGSHWVGLTGDSFLQWAERQQRPAAPSTPASAEETEEPTAQPFLELPIPTGPSRVYENVRIEKHRAGGTPSGLRHYIADLAPNGLYTSGPIVDALLRCRAESYLTFRLIHSQIWQSGKAVAVPSSRAEIFKDTSLLPGEKRTLMRILKGISEAHQGNGPLKANMDDRPFAEFLQQEGLPPSLQKVMLYGLAMLDRRQFLEEDSRTQACNLDASQSASEATVPQQHSECQAGKQPLSESRLLPENESRVTAAAALVRLGRYIESVSSYGGAFMFPEYGSGELPQAFCRAAAVRGAIYVLRRKLQAVLLDRETQQCQGVKTASGQVLRSRCLAGHIDLLPPAFCSPSTKEIVRATAFLDSPLLEPDKAVLEQNTGTPQILLIVPPDAISEGLPENPVRVLQLSRQSLTAPEDRYVLHLSTLRGGRASDEVLMQVLAGIMAAKDYPCEHMTTLIVYGQKSGFDEQPGKMPGNVALCQPPDESVGYAAAVEGARRAFSKLFPDLQMLPDLPQRDNGYDSD